MPFTPFHVGAALLAKPAAMRNFSVLTFGIAHVAMDIEPGIGMLLGWEVLHGSSHTILGALVIACLVIWIELMICNPILQRFNREVRHYGIGWLAEGDGISRTAVVTGFTARVKFWVARSTPSLCRDQEAEPQSKQHGDKQKNR
jgi:hypothetical protein